MRKTMSKKTNTVTLRDIKYLRQQFGKLHNRLDDYIAVHKILADSLQIKDEKELDEYYSFVWNKIFTTDQREVWDICFRISRMDRGKYSRNVDLVKLAFVLSDEEIELLSKLTPEYSTLVLKNILILEEDIPEVDINELKRDLIEIEKSLDKKQIAIVIRALMNI
jgi:hypothetical protein